MGSIIKNIDLKNNSMFSRNENGKLTYVGKIGREKEFLSREYLRVWYAYCNQRRRCYNKSNTRYDQYGKKGCRVEYSFRELLGWYYENRNEDQALNQIIGRIDHEKGYSLSNIRLETKSYSSKERIDRVGIPNPRRKVKIIDAKSKKLLKVVNSCLLASVETGMSLSSVQRILHKQTKKQLKYIFEYADGGAK